MSRKMVRRRGRICLVAALVALGLACGEEPRVGVVDVEQVFQRSPLAMVAALELKGEHGAVPRELKKRGRALAELRQRLAQRGRQLDPQQRDEIEARISAEGGELYRLQEQHRIDLAAAQQRKGDEMIGRVEAVAREVAQREGLSLLFKREEALYEADGADLAAIDITELVIRVLLDKINPSEIPKARKPGEPSEPEPTR